MTGGPARHGPLLRSAPWARAGLALTLTVIAAIGVLTLILDAAVLRTAGRLGPRLAGQVTVVIWSHGLESADAAAARAGEIIAALPGVKSVVPLDPASSDQLVGRLLGAPSRPDAEARLLAIEGSADPADVERELAAQGVPAKVADHDWKDSAPARTAAAIVAAGALIPLIAVVAFAIGGVMAAGRDLARAARAVEMMRIAGAGDNYLANIVGGRAGGMAITCALWAAAAGLIAAAVLARTPLAQLVGGITRADILSPWPLIVLCAWLAAASAAWLAGRARLRARL